MTANVLKFASKIAAGVHGRIRGLQLKEWSVPVSAITGVVEHGAFTPSTSQSRSNWLQNSEKTDRGQPRAEGYGVGKHWCCLHVLVFCCERLARQNLPPGRCVSHHAQAMTFFSFGDFTTNPFFVGRVDFLADREAAFKACRPQSSYRSSIVTVAVAGVTMSSLRSPPAVSLESSILQAAFANQTN